MLGCELAEVFPIVPLRRARVSIGMTTISDRAYFGIYADDLQSLPDANLLSTAIDESIEELFTLS